MSVPNMVDELTAGARRRGLRLWAFIIMGLFVFLSVADTPAHAWGAKNVFRIRSPSFSPDSKFLVMDYLHADKKAVLAIWDIENERLHKLPEAPKGRGWVTPSFSPDGQQIIFADCEAEGPCQIASVDRDGSHFKRLGSLKNSAFPHIDSPSFSPDGSKVLFVRLTKTLNRGEAFELDLKTGEESQLINFQFSSLMELRYLPDGRNFIFQGKTILTWDDEDIPPGNFILIMGPDYGYGLEPAFIQGNSSGTPSMSADGKKILFRSRTNEMDGVQPHRPNMDLFVRSDGVNHRVTKLGMLIQNAVLSPDGKTVFFYADVARAPNWRPTSKKDVYGFWLMNSDGTDMREIRFPDQPEKHSELVDNLFEKRSA